MGHSWDVNKTIVIYLYDSNMIIYDSDSVHETFMYLKYSHKILLRYSQDIYMIFDRYLIVFIRHSYRCSKKDIH